MRRIGDELPFWSETLPQLPRLIHAALANRATAETLQQQLATLVAEQKRHTLLLAVLAAVAVSALLVIAFSRFAA